MRFVSIRKEISDAFSQNHPKGHVFQSSQWAAVKKCWQARYIGGYDEEDKLVLTCVLLTRTFSLFHIPIGYIPRGPVCDSGDRAVLRAFVAHMRAYCRQNRLAFLVLDPDIPLRINGLPVEEGKTEARLLADCGLKCKKSGNFEMIQANSVFRIHWKGGADPDAVRTEIFRRFDKKTRYNIRIAQRRKLTVEMYDSSNLPEERLQTFCNLMERTGRRDRFVPMDRDYFKRLMECLGSHAKLFLIRYDPEADWEDTQKEMESLSRRLTEYRSSRSGGGLPADAGAKCREAERQLNGLRERSDHIRPLLGQGCRYLSGSILGIWGEKSWYLYGASSDICRDTMPNYLMQWSMIRTAAEAGCLMDDLRGVSTLPREDHPLFGLYRFKKGFGGDLEEFPGEFFLVNNQPVYWLFDTVFPRFKTVRRFWVRLTARCRHMMERS